MARKSKKQKTIDRDFALNAVIALRQFNVGAGDIGSDLFRDVYALADRLEAYADANDVKDPKQPVHGNRVRRDGVDRCVCGCKYWERDRCIDCGSYSPEAT